MLHRLIRRSIDGYLAGSARLSRASGRARPRGRLERSGIVNGWRPSGRCCAAGTAVGGIATLTIMSLAGIPGPFLASAGVGWRRPGFGAQSLVKDFLSGTSIVEDQYGGRRCRHGTIKGIVEDVSLRSPRSGIAGVLWHVRQRRDPHARQQELGWGRRSSRSRSPTTRRCPRPLDVQPRSSTPLADDPKWSTKIVERPQVLGVERVEGASVTLSILLRCIPGEEFDAQRAMRRRAKVALDAAGIPGPRLPAPSASRAPLPDGQAGDGATP